MSTLNEESIATDILLSFIAEMNKWEKFCNDIEDDDDLTEDQQFAKQKKELVNIFNNFCTKKERKNGRPNTISYGMDGSYDYDIKDEKVLSTELEKSDRIIIYTGKEKPMKENFMYILLKQGGKWLIDSKKRESSWEKKWKVVSL